MKNHFRGGALVALLFCTVLASAQSPAPAPAPAPAVAPAPSNAGAELNALLAQLNQKIQAQGGWSNDVFAPEIAHAKALAVKYGDEKTEEGARILLLLAHLYAEFIPDKPQALVLAQKVKTGGYPQTEHVVKALAMIEAKATPRVPLNTPWTDKVDPRAPLPEYPRPQLQRDAWINLNGSWDYAILPRDEAMPPKDYAGKILVPFPVESRLSGVEKEVSPAQRLWCRRTFEIPPAAAGKKLLLHFGAVDWQTEVWVNGQLLGRHEGGFDSFSFDIGALLLPGRPQEIVVAIWDPTDAGSQPRGKQTLKPADIFYTAVTGIWQTVWLEPVPNTYVQGLRIRPDFDHNRVSFQLKGATGGRVEIRVLAAGREVAKTEVTEFGSQIDYSNPITLQLPADAIKPWSPDDPFLYDVEITLRTAQTEDRVKSYFGLRKIERKVAADGFERLFLNNAPVFQYGPLDQGWWPDGLYTAPTDEALRWDIETMKRMGFNMVRKHIKVEPARWYYHCDRLGLMVWQDMPSAMNGTIWSHLPPRQQPIDGVFSPADHAQFRRELENMINGLAGFPSIVAWVPFNECWGQHSTNETLAAVKQLDPTRLVDGPSGWNDLGFGDMIDMHDYPGPNMHPARAGRASVLGEFGGLGLPVKGHLWQQDKNWGYRDFASGEEVAKQYAALVQQLRPLVAQGLAAAVYTQLTDVEGEVNGFVTYDRQVVKIPVEQLAELHRALIKGAAPATP